MRGMKTAELKSMAKHLGVRLTPGQKQDSIRHDVMRDLRRRLGAPEPRDQKERERLELLSVRELIEGAPEGTRFPSAASKQDLVEIRLGDGPVEDFHAGTMQPRAQAVKDAFDSGTTDRKYFSGGSMGQVAHVDTGNGRQLIRKRMADDWFMPAKQSIDAEQLISELGERVDAPQAAGYRPGEKVYYGEYIPGPMAFSHGDEAIAAAVATPKGRRIAILDAIVGSSDRHNNNFKIVDGAPIGFDNSLAFDRNGRGLDFGPDGEILPGGVHSEDPFEQHYQYRTKILDTTSFPGLTLVKGGEWLDQHPFPKEELLDFRRELDAMKPQFEKLDRQGWWDQSSQRLDALIKRARTAKELGITLPPKERASIRTTERTRVPGVPERAQRVPDTSDVTPTILTGRQGVDTSDMGPAGDTGPGGIPAKDFTLRSGYHIQHGTFYRKDKIPYLVEHEDTPEGKAHADEIQKALALHRQSLPLSKRRLQRSYSWVRGRNPKDEETARRHGFDPEEWLSEATSDSLGGVTVYNRDEFGFDGVDQQLDHEFAHTLDHVGKEMGGVGSSSPQWHAAGASDATHRRVRGRGRRGRRQTLSDVTFDQGPGEHSRIRLKNAKPLPGVLDYIHGVTDYGVSNDAEDYAESFRLYRAGPIGNGRRTPGGPIEPLWFRDIYPARAAILDKAVPDFAEKQLRQIDQARGTDLSAAQRTGLIKRLVKERDSSERSVAFRDLAKTAPRPRSSIRTQVRPTDRVISGSVPLGQDIRSAFDGDIGPDGVEIGDGGLHLVRHDYTIKNGRAWRDGDDIYVIEGRNTRQMRRQLEALRAERARLPRELGKHSQTFVVVDGHSPSALRRLERSAAPAGMRPFASAGDGAVTFWGRRNAGLLGRDGQFAPTLRHEASHNSDTAFGRPSLSPEWLDAAQAGAKGSRVRSFDQWDVPGQGPLRFKQSPELGRMYPDGVTPYALSNGREDWAEASEFYFGTDVNGGVIGLGSMEGMIGAVPIWFRDLFPARAAILDRYYPEFAAQQLAEIRRRRG
jgi:hypothetical protein